MKKILLLVSCLLILCMAGSAMATATVVVPSTIAVYPNSEGDVDLQLKEFDAGTYTLKLSVDNSANLEAEIIDSSGLLTIGKTAAGSSNTKSITLDENAHSAKIHIVRHDGTAVGKVTVSVNNIDATTFVSGETVKVNAPEFPTVAAPVAAVLGLLFIIGRKKEGL